MLPLKVVVLPARSGKPAADPVFYFEGGPGEAATGSAGYVNTLWINQDNDVVLMDQRGTGPGHALDCKLPGSGEDVQGYLAKPYDAFAACAADLGRTADLTQYVTPIAARDVDDLRRALGYARVNVYGASYGSRMAMIYARMYAPHVRSAYFSGAAPLEQRLPLYFPRSSQAALDGALGECAASPACASRYPDPKADLAAARERLRLTPARVSIKHPGGEGTVEVTVDDWAFATALFNRLYVSGTPETVPDLLRRAREGDLSDLIGGWVKSLHAGRNGGMHWGMNRAIVCSEDVARIRPEEVEPLTAGTLLGPGIVTGTIAFCRSWPKAELPSDYFDDFRSPVPTLISSGEFDPVTPPHWGEVTRRHFPHSLHIVTPQGHSQFKEDGCLGEINSEFLARGTVEGLDLSCARQPENRFKVMG